MQKPGTRHRVTIQKIIWFMRRIHFGEQRN